VPIGHPLILTDSAVASNLAKPAVSLSSRSLPLGFTLESVPYVPHSRAPGKTVGELLFIERIRTRASASSSTAVRLGIGDDCAILKPPPGQEILVTTDFSLEGRHFRRDWHSPASAGHRTVARGLSDLAAMGAKPLTAFLSLALPKSVARNTHWLDGFLDGLLALARIHHISLAGGDTSESPSDHILADIILIGSAPAGRALRRSTARAGDVLYCTGSLGGAAAELASLTASPRKFRNAQPTDNHPHLFPQPRLAVGQTLLRRGLATACIDLSDGLSTDLAHLCAASHVAAELDLAQLPLHPLAAALDDRAQINALLHGGEDYELLFTAAPTTKIPRSIANVRITRIGRIVKPQPSRPLMSLLSDGLRFDLQPHGWEHLT
jgi:thiamine-monophosphate kinase